MNWIKKVLTRLERLSPFYAMNAQRDAHRRYEESDLIDSLEKLAEARAQRHIDQITKTIGVMIHSNVISDRELGLCVGKLQENDPELASRLNELRTVIRRMSRDN